MELLDTRTVASMIGLAPHTLVLLRVSGGGPRYVKLGRRVLYDRADIASWIEQKKRAHTSEDATSTSSAR
jgi:predicted DNA-binding transcriptional regulator AlpA